MSSADQINIVLLVELAHNVFAECEADASVVVTVLINATLRVRPQKIAKESLVWHICWSNYILDLVEVFQLWAQASVHAENFLIDKSSHWKTVKHITEYSPELNRVPSFAFIVETIDAIDLGTLMVSAQHEEVLWVLNLIAKQKSNGLN